MERNIGAGALLALTDSTKGEKDSAVLRESAPDVILRQFEQDARQGRRAKWTYAEAVIWKAHVDLTRLGLAGKTAAHWIANSTRIIEHGRSIDRDGVRLELVQPRDFWTWTGDDLFLCLEAFTADYLASEKKPEDRHSVTWWGGTADEIALLVANENAEWASSGRETMSTQLYNLSKAVRFVRDRLDKVGGVE